MKTNMQCYIWLFTTSVMACTCGGRESTEAPPQSLVVQNDADETPVTSKGEQTTTETASASSPAPLSKAACNRDLEETQCKQVGGDFGPHGKAQMRYCICPTSDGGKACTDSAACEGYCECEGPEDTEGRCSARVRRFGCFCRMNGGKPMRMCMD